MQLPKKFALTKELIIILIVKGILLTLLWWFCFSHPVAEKINNNTVFVDHLLTTHKDSNDVART